MIIEYFQFYTEVIAIFGCIEIWLICDGKLKIIENVYHVAFPHAYRVLAYF